MDGNAVSSLFGPDACLKRSDGVLDAADPAIQLACAVAVVLDGESLRRALRLAFQIRYQCANVVAGHRHASISISSFLTSPAAAQAARIAITAVIAIVSMFGAPFLVAFGRSLRR
jgi:hypothetical protein